MKNLIIIHMQFVWTSVATVNLTTKDKFLLHLLPVVVTFEGGLREGVVVVEAPTFDVVTVKEIDIGP